MSPLINTRVAQTPPWVKDSLWRRARAVPSLDLRFADNKSLVDATTGQNLVTFSRASGGTYTDSQGVIRNAVTNLLLQSEDFSTTWAQTNIGITPSAGVSPSGALNASKLVSTSGNIGYLLQTPAVLSGACTYSVYAKAAEWSWFLLWVFDGVSASLYNFDLQNGTSPDGTITAVGGGWYRCSKTVNLLGGTNSGRVRLYPNNQQGPAVTTGDGTSGIYLWGAQLEQSSTVGEYIPTTSSINSAPRFDHDPTTGESLGLLVEELRTNLLTYTEECDNAAWTLLRCQPFGSGSIANATTAPNGTLTADKIAEDTTASNNHLFQNGANVTAGSTYTASVFLKAAERTWALVLVGGTTFGTHGLYVNLATGVAGATAGSPIATSITRYADGWVRVSVTQTASLTAVGLIQIRLATGDGGQTYTGDGASGIYVWGAQLEQGSFPTSYIKNVDTALGVTRLPDIAQISGTNFSSWYRQDEGTVFADAYASQDTSATTARIVGVSDGTTSNRIIIYRNCSSDIAQTLTTSGASTQASIAESGWSSGLRLKSATAFALDNVGASFGGSVEATDTSASIPSVSQMVIGGNETGAASLYANAPIRRLVFWPQRLGNEVLQGLTQ